MAQRATAPEFALAAASQQEATELLRQRLMRVAAETGATIKTVQDIQTDAASTRVRVRADLQLELPQLVSSLRRLQTEEPHVIVQYLSVAADRALETNRLSVLDVRVELEAEWRPGAAEPG